MLGITPVAVAIAAALALAFDWNWIKRPKERYVSTSAGRTLVLAGNISADWSAGLLRPRFTFRGVRLANPDWADVPWLIDVREVSVLLPLSRMFRRPLRIEKLAATGTTVALEVETDGRHPWLLDRKQADPGATVSFDRIVMDGARVCYLQKVEGTNLMAGAGEISNLLLEVIGLDGGEALSFLLSGDRTTRLRCAVASMPIVNGTVTAEAVVMDTDDTHVVVTDSADLRSERLDFTMRPKAKDWSMLAVRSPIHCAAHFCSPSFQSMPARWAHARQPRCCSA